MRIELPAQDLLALIAQQDVAALSELYDRYSPRVYGLLARILISRETAEDVLLEVFASLCRGMVALKCAGGRVEPPACGTQKSSIAGNFARGPCKESRRWHTQEKGKHCFDDNKS
jgi:hypothetical protein